MKILKNICTGFLALWLAVTVAEAEPADRSIELDVRQVEGPLNTFFKTSIGAGRANEGLRADWQQQLAQVKQDAGFKYIRMHGLLTDDMAVYRHTADGKPQYNFMYIDALYDAILATGMKPFVELGFMPHYLASGDKTIFWWQGNVTPPSDYAKWQDLIRALVQHFTDRYGEAEVKTWYFEVWNEPNLEGFWAGSQAEYFKLYASAAAAVKSVNADYRVGGPATAGAAWIPEMIAYCQQHDVPLDFVSTHAYGVKQGYLDEFGTTGTVLSEDEWAVSGDVLKNRQEIAASAMPGLELHYTEWSSSYTPADPIHDSYHSASYILQKLKQVGKAANSMSYWVFTDIFEEAGPRFTPFHGGFGLMNIQGIKKPAYFAYQFLNHLGSVELTNPDQASWATKGPDGSVQVLLWDYSYTLPEGINNQQYYIRDLPAADKGQVAVNIKGLKPGRYQLKIYQVGYRHNDAYTGYLDLGSPNQLTKAQVAGLKALATGDALLQEAVNIDRQGEFSRVLPLRENDVYLVELTRK